MTRWTAIVGLVVWSLGGDFYVVLITLRQSAVLKSGQELSVRTFEDGASEWTVAADRDRRVRAAVKEEVSRFINAWGIANRQ